jgi:hypothetical protein
MEGEPATFSWSIAKGSTSGDKQTSVEDARDLRRASSRRLQCSNIRTESASFLNGATPVDTSCLYYQVTRPSRRPAMPRYYFNLRGHGRRDIDPDGTDLADDGQAREHAKHVALELMQGRETNTRPWRLEVCDAERTAIFELLFATVDPSIAGLSPELRNAIELSNARMGALLDAIVDVHHAFYELQATLSRAENKPYLASRDGIVLSVGKSTQ